MPKVWGRVQLSYTDLPSPFYVGAANNDGKYYSILEATVYNERSHPPGLVTYELVSGPQRNEICNGASGGGFLHHNGTFFVQTGVLSLASIDKKKGILCTLPHLRALVYVTSLAKHQAWIESIITSKMSQVNSNSSTSNLGLNFQSEFLQTAPQVKSPRQSQAVQPWPKAPDLLPNTLNVRNQEDPRLIGCHPSFARETASPEKMYLRSDPTLRKIFYCPPIGSSDFVGQSSPQSPYTSGGAATTYPTQPQPRQTPQQSVNSKYYNPQYSHLDFSRLDRAFQLTQGFCSRDPSLKIIVDDTARVSSEKSSPALYTKETSQKYPRDLWNTIVMDPQTFSSPQGTLEYILFHECCHVLMHRQKRSIHQPAEKEANQCAQQEILKLLRSGTTDPLLRTAFDYGVRSFGQLAY